MANSVAKTRAKDGNNVVVATSDSPPAKGKGARKQKAANTRQYWSIVEALAGVVTALIIGAIVVRRRRPPSLLPLLPLPDLTKVQGAFYFLFFFPNNKQKNNNKTS